MTKKLKVLLDEANELVKDGTKQTEQIIYLLTFRYSNITAAEAVKYAEVASTTTRRVLNTLFEKGLIFKDPLQKRNVEYFNYDVLELFDM